MSEIKYAPLFYLTRGDMIESIHYGSIAVVNNQNELVAWYGNPDTETFLRSSAKPFQAIPFIEAGGHEAFHLTTKEIALCCASHSGTDEHMAVVEAIQAKCGIKESELLCGVDFPGDKETAQELVRRGEEPTQNRHNCSGKHTGMIALAKLRNLPYHLNDQPYIDPSHPIQSMILENFAAMCGLSPGHVHIGIDGCSAPNFAIPLRNAALGYARLCDPRELPDSKQKACQTVTSAMMTNPSMVGGPGRFISVLMESFPGKIICKGGAEGYQGIGIMPGALGPDSPALGIAIKISDGGFRSRVRNSITLAVLRQLSFFVDQENEPIQGYQIMNDVTNFRKLVVGRSYPSFKLNFKQ